MKNKIKNTDELVTTKERKDILEIVENAYEAIDTESVLDRMMSSNGHYLHIDGHIFDLTQYERVRVIGFGKASCSAILKIEQILEGIELDGVAIDKKPGTCESVDIKAGSHPRPSSVNVEISGEIVKIAKESNEKDLVIVVVSGGGSSLLCWPASECDQGAKLYDKFLGLGATIDEINTVRKHISMLKGGGLAKLLFPATVASLVFCDVPGNKYDIVASGPTYKDNSTVADAEAILQKYDLGGEFDLVETPDEDKFFEKVFNIPVVSNISAIEAMEEKARELGYEVNSLGAEIYDFTNKVIERMLESSKPGAAVVAGGEPRLIIKGGGGTGGRNLYVAMEALKHIKEDDTFCAFASDGIDNKSKYAGAVIDKNTLDTISEKNLNLEDYIERYDPEGLFEKTGGMIETGPTGSNVSDLMVSIRKK